MSRIALGTAVTPLGGENPLRLAEDLDTVGLQVRGGWQDTPGARMPRRRTLVVRS